MTHLLGREEGIENSTLDFRRDAGTIITKFETNTELYLSGLDRNGPSAAADRVTSIHQKI